MQDWQRTSVTILSAKIGGIEDIDIKIIRESLKNKPSLQDYCRTSLYELERNLENYTCIQQNDYQLPSGMFGIQSLCRWNPIDKESYMQILGFIIYKNDGYRLFSILAQPQWQRIGQYLMSYMRTIEVIDKI